VQDLTGDKGQGFQEQRCRPRLVLSSNTGTKVAAGQPGLDGVLP
jgi:hypothetical protein